MIPLIAALAVHIRINPLFLMIPGTLSCSCAFMLPVATPPDAIIFWNRTDSDRRYGQVGSGAEHDWGRSYYHGYIHTGKGRARGRFGPLSKLGGA
ncbi:MAG: anion permease [Nitrospinae bacterium]|nr:anion permease [Nitrospinota bacterium]